MDYARFGGLCAILAAVAGLVYGVAFVILDHELLSGLALMLGGLLGSAALVALYERVRDEGGGFALLALLLGVAGALGAAVHGGYDLANVLHPPPDGIPDLPSAVDPRGLLTFGVSGLALLVVAWLLGRAGGFPRGLSVLAYVSAVLLLVLYLGRLVILDATSLAILVPAALSGFIINPAFYVWLGLELRLGRPAA